MLGPGYFPRQPLNDGDCFRLFGLQLGLVTVASQHQQVSYHGFIFYVVIETYYLSSL
jgi:hypothetical protein